MSLASNVLVTGQIGRTVRRERTETIFGRWLLSPTHEINTMRSGLLIKICIRPLAISVRASSLLGRAW